MVEKKITEEDLQKARDGAKEEMKQALPVIIKLLEDPKFVADNNEEFQFDVKSIFEAFMKAVRWTYRRPLSDKVGWDVEKKSKDWVN